jgi:hypothetical protein
LLLGRVAEPAQIELHPVTMDDHDNMRGQRRRRSPGRRWLLVAATSLGFQALTTPSGHGLEFIDNLFDGIDLWTSVTTESWRQ